MPKITYRGRKKAGVNMGRLGWWMWGVSRDVTEEWLESHRAAVNHSDFLIEGYSFTTVDEGNDGIPDMSWTKGDIMAWMDENDVEYSSLNTKAKLLAKVEEHLNPTEETNNEAEEAQTTGEDE